MKLSSISLKVAALSVVLLTASLAKADTFVFNPDPIDLNDLDHHSVYTWRISGVDLTGQTITEAKLTFDNIANWENSANSLHIHLLDTARRSGVRSFLDDDPDHDHVTDLTDDFVSTRYHNGKDATGANATWLVTSGTADTLLVNKSFTTTPTDYTYDFVANGTSGTLLNYFLNGNNIAIGLDPDCHYYNDGITLTIKTVKSNSNAQSALPEPGTLALFGTIALPILGMIRRRKN